MEKGWDMTQRIAQMKAAPEDIGTLRAMLALQTLAPENTVKRGKLEDERSKVVVQAEHAPPTRVIAPPDSAAFSLFETRPPAEYCRTRLHRRQRPGAPDALALFIDHCAVDFVTRYIDTEVQHVKPPELQRHAIRADLPCQCRLVAACATFPTVRSVYGASEAGRNIYIPGSRPYVMSGLTLTCVAIANRHTHKIQGDVAHPDPKKRADVPSTPG